VNEEEFRYAMVQLVSGINAALWTIAHSYTQELSDSDRAIVQAKVKEMQASADALNAARK
jgi:hypothetical protein